MRVLPLLTMLACAQADPAPPTPYVIPDGATAYLYAPLYTFTTFPDDVHTVADPDTSTGLRVRLISGAREELDALLPDSIPLIEALEELDGFGTSAGVQLRFSDDVDPASFERALHVLRVRDGAPVDVEVWWTDGTRTAVVEPLRPLEERQTHALLVDASLVDAEGEPVWASTDLHALLHGGGVAPELERVRPVWEGALAAAELGPDQVVAGTVFTTQDVRSQDDRVIALLDELEPELVAGPCLSQGTYTTCAATLEVLHPLGDDLVLGADEDPVLTSSYTLPVDVHLPADGTGGPYPVVLFGHGLGGDKGEARGVARDVAELGFAVVAVDAPMHGDHPTRVSDGDLFWVLDFFGIVIAEAGLDVRRLRDNFRLAVWDKLQLTAALRAGVDLDGDGDHDLDPEELHFSGHSLGGIMGVPLVARDPHIRSAHLSVPGGRISTIVHRGATFAPLVALMAPPGTSTAEVDRFFPLLQAAIERGEPANVAGDILASGRDVFATQVIDDDIIPNTCGRYMARALGVEHVGPPLQPIAGLPHRPIALPVSGNVGGATGAWYQYDEMRQDGVRTDATHSHIYGSDTHQAQLSAWLSSVLDGRGEVIEAPPP